ncbi:hypothetical protein [Rubripirellula amarantea]|uniref:hypothetical protein n=1 Tax=Rubripirellula amarantea TaxID=2527999 RepID=UPI0013EEFBD7|nr:hypothetical protein [Rubripirellula amarantea]
MTGFHCELRATQMDMAGYLPVEIKLVSTATFTADRDLVIRFVGVDGAVTPPQRNMLVDVPVEISQGNRVETYVRLIPRWALTRFTNVSILEDGRPIPDYQAAMGAATSSQLSAYRFMNNLLMPEVTSDLLMITDSSDELSVSTNFIFPNSAYIAPAATKLSPAEIPTAQAAKRYFHDSSSMPLTLHDMVKLPTDWRGYQPIDCLLVHQSTLEKLFRDGAPESIAAIRAWLMLGGTMIVSNARSADETTQTMGVSNTPLVPAEFQTSVYVSQEIWRNTLPLLKRLQVQASNDAKSGRSLSIIEDMSWRSTDSDVGFYLPSLDLSADEFDQAISKSISQLESELTRSEKHWQSRVWVCMVGSGRLIGLLGDAPETGNASEKEEVVGQTPASSISDWQLAKSLIGYRTSPTLRRGVDPMIGNVRFRDWLIPGVAQPPVYTFMGLLTAFVMLVGPVAYRQTTKRDRSYLMFAIAPALAVVTTLLMFGYGIIADGFGTKARVRQIAITDAKSEFAVERTRTTYFAGVRPSDGIRFAADAEVMGYPESIGQSWEEQNRFPPAIIGRVEVTETGQRFDASFLPSRQQTQFVVHQPRPNFGKLTIQSPDRTSLSVANGFSFLLDQLVVCDSQGQHWLIDEIAAGETKDGALIETKFISRVLGDLYNENRPIMLTGEQSSSTTNTGETYNVVSDLASQTGNSSITSGSLELELQSLLQNRGTLSPGHFIAIAEPSDDALAVDNAEIIRSVRYVMGTFEFADSILGAGQ